MSRFGRPRQLDDDDRLDGFECRSDEQTEWLRRHARQSVAASLTRVLVTQDLDSSTVAGYFAWRMSQIGVRATPARWQKGTGRYPQPVVLLARLAVDTRYEGRGLGAGLLLDAISRMTLLREEIGCRGLLLHAADDTARAFYLHLIPELVESPTDPLHLLLLHKDAVRTLRR